MDHLERAQRAAERANKLADAFQTHRRELGRENGSKAYQESLEMARVNALVSIAESLATLAGWSGERTDMAVPERSP